ncbi:MAG TPA: sigma-70 family RNA polymerase sigma factor [Gemmataceae bacterium]|nr:sigma-70 family RNA polymerase sigma factor [Gemmataceae bacterium]
MTPDSLTGVVHRLRVVVDPAAPERSDADLVRSVARHRDSAAFADVVRRHGPMVLGTCRRVLRDHADADDAFQATFLVFLRRAGELRRPERLAGWLFQVAYRTSQKLRAGRLARRGREVELFDLPAGEPPAEFVWRELRPIFDAELARLPDRLRLPAVLCLLEGRSKRDAARTLGWPEGTVAGRLQQARETLRRRLTARGLTLSAGALAVALFEGAGAVAVPPALFASTIHGLAAGSASVGAAALADGVIHAMFVTKVKALTAVVLLSGLVGTGTGVVLTPGPGPAVALADGPVKEKGPVPRKIDSEPRDLAATRAQIEAIGNQENLQRIEVKVATEELLAVSRTIRKRLEDKLAILREAERGAGGDQKAKLVAEIRETEAQIKARQEPDLNQLRKERDDLKRELDRQREAAVLADLNAKNLYQKHMNLLQQVELLTVRLRELEQAGRHDGDAKPAPPGIRGKVLSVGEPGSNLAQINIGSDAGLARGHVLTVFVESEYKGELTVTAVDPKTAVAKFTPARRGVEIKKDDSVITHVASAEPDRAAQRARLEADVAQLRDRKAYAERMVQKGFMTQAQLAADTAKLAEAEALLAKLDAAQSKGPAAADLAAKLREIDREKQAREVERLRDDLKRTEELFKKGLVAQVELDAAKVRLAQAEIDLQKLTPPPAADGRRAELERMLRFTTRLLEQVEAGHKQGTIPEAEVLHHQVVALRTRFDLLGLDAATDPKAAAERGKLRDDLVALLDRRVALAEAANRKGVVPDVEVWNVRAETANQKAALADALGEYALAVRLRTEAADRAEAVLKTTADARRQMLIPESEVRQAQLAAAAARADLHRAALRKELADVVTIREADLAALRAVASKVPAKSIQAAERALAEARAKLAEGK